MDEDDLMWFKNEKNTTMYWSTSFMEIFVPKPLVVGKLGLFSGMQNDGLRHRGGLTL